MIAITTTNVLVAIIVRRPLPSFIDFITPAPQSSVILTAIDIINEAINIIDIFSPFLI
jgi:hypothetical protein